MANAAAQVAQERMGRGQVELLARFFLRTARAGKKITQ